MALAFVDAVVDAASMKPRPQERNVGSCDTALVVRIEQRARERLAASRV